MLGRINVQTEDLLEENAWGGKDKNHWQKILDLARLKWDVLIGGKKELTVANVYVAPERSIQEKESPAKVWDQSDQEPVWKISIKEIYEKYGLETDGMHTVYMIDRFIKALPDLPASIKRQSVLNLIAASQLDVLKLLQDGSSRLEVLNQYDNYFSAGLAEEMDTHTKQIGKLMEEIAYHNSMIEEKKQIRTTELAEIQFEIQKITGILEFIETR